VDVHGDAFERQLEPRPGVGFDPPLALRDTEAQLLASGITTAFHGITLSWEPGLRGAANWRALVDAIAGRDWDCDMRVHLRWEVFNLDALAMAVADIAAGRVHLLAFNDHTPSILRRVADPVAGAKYSDRAGISLADFRALADRVGGMAEAVPDGLARIAAAARAAGLPMASHDDATPAMREAARRVLAGEPPERIHRSLARAARAAGDWVVMGCPNVVRGGSHLGWASAAAMAEAGICSVLCSDYFYPAMPAAPFALARRGRLDLAAAWTMVSANPAAAARLDDRGRVAAGLRADLAVVDPETERVVATIARGRLAHLRPEAVARLR
jgi:alpha-D-ribose 1-methylphosphonate 5-triphosphate diphosphatase